MEYCDELLGKMKYINLLAVINSSIAVVFFVIVIEPVKPEFFYLISFAHA